MRNDGVKRGGIYWLTEKAERLLDELERDSGPPDAGPGQSEGEGRVFGEGPLTPRPRATLSGAAR